jgi:alpha-galactosidase
MDTTAWSDEHRRAAKQQFAIYKNHLRGLIASADIYHVLPRPAEKSWDGIEYFDSDSGRGALIVFRAESEIPSRRVVLRGLNAQRLYLLNSVDGMFADMKVSGRQLGDRGLVLRLPEKNSSDIILFRELTEDMSKKFKGKY